MPKMIVLKGTSGVGKGTRVVQFLEWLRTNHEPKELTYTLGDKTRPLGILFEDLRLIFIGQYTVSNKSGLASWSSMDAMHAACKTGEVAREILTKYTAEGYTLVCEGEPLMLSDKWRPQFLFENYGLDAIALLYFHYPDRFQYNARIVGRSGKEAGDSGWSRNENYQKEFIKSREEMTDLGWVVHSDPFSGLALKYKKGDNISELSLYPYDAPLNSAGRSIMALLGEEYFSQEDHKVFTEYCKQNPMLRDIHGNNPLSERVSAKEPKKASKSTVAKVVKSTDDTPVKPKTASLAHLLGRK